MNYKLNYMCLKRGVSLILGHGVDMFIRFNRMYERDRQTDGQTDRQTPHDGKRISRQKFGR